MERHAPVVKFSEPLDISEDRLETTREESGMCSNREQTSEESDATLRGNVSEEMGKVSSSSGKQKNMKIIWKYIRENHAENYY